MSRVFLRRELEGVATFWRVHRRDGVTLGFTSHDLDLAFGGVTHRAAPGMVPAAIRRTADFTDDSAEADGILAHDSISEGDLAAGRFDQAAIEMGAVDWETGEHAVLYTGTLGAITTQSGGFSAELRSAKAALERDPVPRTSPTCRAEFCGPGCNLSPARFTREAVLAEVEPASGELIFAGIDPALYAGGELRWLDGPECGRTFGICGVAGAALLIDHADTPPPSGTRALLREGCDRTIATCAARFGNALNFQGEPFLPGNDLLARYPQGGGA